MPSTRTKSHTPSDNPPHGNVSSGNTDQENPDNPASVLVDTTPPVTTSDDNSNNLTVHLPVIKKIMLLCGFSANSTMRGTSNNSNGRNYTMFSRLLWMKLRSSRPFATMGTSKRGQKQINLRMFKAFLLYCKRKVRDWSTPISEEDVMDMDKDRLCQYWCSAD
jgi:hypothetical protein